MPETYLPAPACPNSCDDTWTTCDVLLDSPSVTGDRSLVSQALGIKLHPSQGILASTFDSSSASPRTPFLHCQRRVRVQVPSRHPSSH